MIMMLRRSMVGCTNYDSPIIKTSQNHPWYLFTFENKNMTESESTNFKIDHRETVEVIKPLLGTSLCDASCHSSTRTSTWSQEEHEADESESIDIFDKWPRLSFGIGHSPLSPGISIPKHIPTSVDFLHVVTPEIIEPEEEVLERSSAVLSTKECLIDDDLLVGYSKCPDYFFLQSKDLEKQAMHSLTREEKPVEEDRALKNWRKWMNIRLRVHKFLKRKLRRDDCNLVMCSGDQQRKKVEDDMVKENMKVVKGDRWRGHPSFWYTGERLAKKCMIQDYISQPDRVLLGVKHELERVRVPRVIKREKDEECVGFGDKTKMEDSLKTEVGDGDFDDLVVIGKGADRLKDEECLQDKELSEIVLKKRESVPEINSGRESVVSLLICGVSLEYKNKLDGNRSEDDHQEFRLNFESNFVGCLSSTRLEIENQGTVAIRYQWRKHKEPEESERKLLPTFFFNKNEGVFLPGEIYNLEFLHKSYKPGISTESWELVTSPILLKTVFITLYATDTTEVQLQDVWATDEYLSRQAAERVVRELLEEVVSGVGYLAPEEIEYRSFFVEEELFELNNCKYFYDADIVEEMKVIFKELPHTSKLEWDFSLSTLRSLIQESLPKEEKCKVLQNLSVLCAKMLKPPCKTIRRDRKYEMSYNVLCRAVNSMELCGENLRTILEVRRMSVDKDDSVVKKRLKVMKSSSVVSRFTLSEMSGGVEEEVVEQPPSNYDFYLQSLYIQVYQHLSVGVDNLAAVVQSCNLFEP